jgi:glycosyltransferase involved in cell wall biosynthesis
VEGASEFCGGASATQIAEIYAKADILLHMESFDKRAIASTKYSFSTKIPEYLSANKCVLAVGPDEVASVRYLADFACVISDSSLLSSALSKLIDDKEYRNQIRVHCGERYLRDFTCKKQTECLNKILSC